MRIGEAVCHPSTPFPFRVQCRRRAFISAPRVRIRLVVSYSERRNVSSTSDENSFTEGLRRKLWRTHDHGPKDLEPDDNQSVRDQETQWEEIAADKQAVEPYNATLPSVTSGDYTPATTWDGLESIGGPEGWWEETWDHNNRFEGLVLLVATGENADHHSRSFMAPHMITTREDISRAIHRAFVEIFTLKEAGLPIDISGDFVQTSQTDYIKDVSFKQAEDGTTVPVFVQEKLRKEILDSLTTEHDELNTNDPNGSLVDVLGDTQVVEDKGAISTAKTQTSALIDLGAGDLEHTESTVQTEKPSLEFAANDETWLNVHFHDIDVKFVVSKLSLDAMISMDSTDGIDSQARDATHWCPHT